MYGRGSGILSTAIITGSATAGGSAAIASQASTLPETSGNMTATVLAVTAISFGIGIIISQIAVRVLRKKYSK